MAHFKNAGDIPAALPAVPTTQTQQQDPVKAALRSSPKFVRELIAGGVAGGLAKTAVAPLERAKILFQTRRLANMGITGILGHMWKTEGMAGMFRGNSASVLRIVPYAAIHFGAYENYKRFLVDHLISPSSDTHGRGDTDKARVHPQWDLLAGSAAGATAVLLTYPLDLVRTRMAWSTDTVQAGGGGGVHGAGSGARAATGVQQGVMHPSSSHAGIFRTLMMIWKEEGQLVGLYRGVSPTLLGILPYAGLKFYVYTSLKNWYRELDHAPAAPRKQPPHPQPSSSPTSPPQQRPPFPATSTSRHPTPAPADAAVHLANAAALSDCVALDSRAPGPGGHTEPVQSPAPGRLPLLLMLGFGGLSGLVAQTITYPLDVIRRRMQVGEALPPGQRATTWSVGRMIIQQEGLVGGLMRGLSINYMKVVPSTAIGFTVYDYLKEYLDVRGNL